MQNLLKMINLFQKKYLNMLIVTILTINITLLNAKPIGKSNK